MQPWQIQHITKNLNKLGESTIIYPTTLAAMNKFLSSDDKQELERKKDREGNTAMSILFYERLMMKGDGAYEYLIEILDKGSQPVPAQILKDGHVEQKRMEQLRKIEETIKRNGYAYKSDDVLKALDFINSKEPLNVEVKKRDKPLPDNTEYNLPPRGKGYAFVLNVSVVSGESVRTGSELDAKYMTALWRGFGFVVFPEEEDIRMRGNYSYDDIVQMMDTFVGKCKTDSVDAIVVFLGSHGDENHIYSSDRQPMDLRTEFMYKLQFPGPKKIPKILIVEACQGLSQRKTPYLDKVDVELNNTIVFKAQFPGQLANRDTYRGSEFIVVLTYVLMKNACNYELKTLFDDVIKLVNVIRTLKNTEGLEARYQLPSYENIGLGPLFLLPPKNSR